MKTHDTLSPISRWIPVSSGLWRPGTTQRSQTHRTRRHFSPRANDDPNSLQSVLLNNQQYYLTMVSRLHNFDGSMTQPSSVYYIEYADPQITKVSLPVITSAIAENASTAQQQADEYNLKAACRVSRDGPQPIYVNNSPHRYRSRSQALPARPRIPDECLQRSHTRCEIRKNL